MDRYWLFLLPAMTFAQVTTAQVTTSDYDRALKTRTRYENLVIGTPGPATWIGDTDQFWYRVSAEGGNRFVVIDARTNKKAPAFDHDKLAAALSHVSGGQTYTAVTLPFATFTYEEGSHAIRFGAAGSPWLCDIETYACHQAPTATTQNRPVRPPEDDAFENPAEPENDVIEGVEYPSPQQGTGRGALPLPADQFKTSPDGKWDALIRNYNVFVREHGKKDSDSRIAFYGTRR